MPIKEPSNDVKNADNDDDERRKSNIALPNINYAMSENPSSFSQSSETNSANSESMHQLQSYLQSEQSLPPSANQQTGMLGVHQQPSLETIAGGTSAEEMKPKINEEIAKRSDIPFAEKKQKS